MKKHISRVLLLILAVLFCVPMSIMHLQASPAVVLGVSGKSFTINGEPRFLLGASYFDARYWRTSDIEGLSRRGYNLIRIWLDWKENGFFNSDGTLRDAQTLQSLVDACAQHGMVIEIALLDTTLPFSQEVGARAAGRVAALLKDRSNVMYDLVNEHDHDGTPFSAQQIDAVAFAVRAADPDAIMMVSSTEYFLIDAKANIKPSNIDKSIKAPGMGVLAPHLPRTAKWYADTTKRVNALRDYLNSAGRDIPIYLNEEARRGHSGLNPTRDQFVEAATRARDAGVAAWIFHTDAGFELKGKSFFDSLDDVERQTVDALPVALGLSPLKPTATATGTTPTAGPSPTAGPAPSTTATPIEPTAPIIMPEAETKTYIHIPLVMNTVED